MRISRIPFAFVLSAVLLFAIAARTAKAGTTYTYTGKAYTTCYGTYTCGSYALSVTFTTTLTGSALANLPLSDPFSNPINNIGSTITSFTFTDGNGLTIDNSNSYSQLFYISTNASGNIVGWVIGACGSTCDIQMQTNWNSPNYSFVIGRDFTETAVNFGGNGGYNAGTPGTWTMQTGAVMQPNNPANLSQPFVFNNTAGQHVEFDFDYNTAYNTNNDLTVVADTIPSVINQGITQATYQAMVYGTSLATTSCYIAPGEGTDDSGNSLCAQLTLTCTNANSSIASGDNCPQSTERNLYWAQVLSTPGSGMTVPPGSAPTLAMGSDTWSPGNCTLVGPEKDHLCPQSMLTQFGLTSLDPLPKSGGTGKTSNSAYVAGCCEPEWTTVAQIPAWSNSTMVPVSFISTPPAAPDPNPNSWVAAPNLSITWGWENLGQTPDTTFPVSGDQTVANATACPNTWPAAGTLPSPVTASGSVTVPGEGAFEVHFFSTACDNQEELVFPSSLGSGTPLNINQATFKTAPFNVDLTPPRVTSITLNPSGGFYAQNSVLTATVVCTDPSSTTSPTVPSNFYSGIAGCGLQSAQQVIGGNQQTATTSPIALKTSTLGSQTFTMIATDVAGNPSAPVQINYTVVGPADVDVGMVGNLLVKSGQNITYLVGIVNEGPNTANLVNLVGGIPAGTAFVSSGYAFESCSIVNHKPSCTLSPPTNSCGSVAGSCNIGTLPAWARRNMIGVLVQITVKVNTLPGATIKGTVSVASANANPDQDNTATWFTKVVK